MGKRWSIQPHDASRIERLQKTTGVSAIVSQLLVSRGIEQPDEVTRFLDPKLSQLRDPEELPGLTEAANRIHRAIAEKSRIIVYGDYDADGMTAVAILFRCISVLGGNVGYYVPNRLEEGYGLHSEALRTLASRGAQLVVTVDCGIASVEQAETALEVGLELILTDHHQFGSQLPRASHIVHPRLPGTTYPFGELCGAGVAFKIAWALCQRSSQAKKVSEGQRNFLLQAMGLVAIGTVADVVPLVDENRVLVRHGLVSLRERPCPGLLQLMAITELNRKPALASEDIAFTLGPRLNAAGRLGQAQLGVELLTTDSAERGKALAEYIHQLNDSRESLERSVYLAANKLIQEEFDPVNDPALVLGGRGWHPGVIGIVAGRLAEKYHRPVVLVAFDQAGVRAGTGSGRTAGRFDLHAAFASCQEHLEGFGGHAAAAGLQIGEASLDAFRAAFCEFASTKVAANDRTAELRIDSEAYLGQLTPHAIQQMELLAPFGAGNPRPLLCCRELELADRPKRIGGGERHLSLKLKQGAVQIRAVGFGQGESAEALSQLSSPIDVAFRPVINDFAGRHNVEMHLVDWRPSQKGTLVSSLAEHAEGS